MLQCTVAGISQYPAERFTSAERERAWLIFADASGMVNAIAWGLEIKAEASTM
jgi:hypothetical protein